VNFLKLGLFLATVATSTITPSREGFVVDNQLSIPAVVKEQTVEEVIVEVFKEDAPTMLAVARCESNTRQFNADGTVLVGITGDLGTFQIAPQYWLESSRLLGYDIYSVRGNVEFAHYLYTRYHLKPWNASSHCWGKLI